MKNSLLKFKKNHPGIYTSKYNGLDIKISNYSKSKWQLSITDESKVGDDYEIYTDFDNSKKALVTLANKFFNN